MPNACLRNTIVEWLELLKKKLVLVLQLYTNDGGCCEVTQQGLFLVSCCIHGMMWLLQARDVASYSCRCKHTHHVGWWCPFSPMHICLGAVLKPYHTSELVVRSLDFHVIRSDWGPRRTRGGLRSQLLTGGGMYMQLERGKDQKRERTHSVGVGTVPRLSCSTLI
jgi:hypothetical protein